MQLTIIGPHPFERDDHGQQKTRIGTLFLREKVLYTQAPAVHAWQRANFLEDLNGKRTSAGLDRLSEPEAEAISEYSVDLVFEPDAILIRPDPKHLDHAFAADDLLQELVSKRQIRFLFLSDKNVREALQRRGENWRLSTLPKTLEAMQDLVLKSKVGIHLQPIYFYNRLTGTRWLTLAAVDKLGALPDPELAAHLQEIADYLGKRNRFHRPELDLFAADLGRLQTRDLFEAPFESLPPDPLRSKYQLFRERFRSLVHPVFHRDDPTNKSWCKLMISTLFLEGNEAQHEPTTNGLSPEFFLQVAWLPGGRFEEGEFLFDSIFEEASEHPENASLNDFCDLGAKGIIFNMIREHGDIEYINVGRVPESLSRKRPQKQGRRGVYIAEFKARSEPRVIQRLIRLQKWGVREHLDRGKDLLQAIRESDEYTDYWLDRRLGCRQLGMNLTPRVVMRRLSEVYRGLNPRYQGEVIRTTYFEREFLTGTATDKIPAELYGKAGYAQRLARVLGEAAVSSIVVGRSLDEGKTAVFDDGDELVCEDPEGLPAFILVADHSGAFGEYKRPLEACAEHYASPVNSRDHLVPMPQAFAEAYLQAFRQQFTHIQLDYRKRRRAFDTLFKHCKYDIGGSFAFRWERVLARLDSTDVNKLVAAIRSKIRILNKGAETAAA